MNGKKLIISLSSLTLSLSSSWAAPAVQLPHEWSTTLESSNGIVLAQTDTGQLRILSFSPSMIVSDSGPVATNLPGLTGMNTGLDVTNSEQVLLSSRDHNLIRIVDSGSFTITDFQPSAPGPITAVPMRFAAPDDPGIYALSAYGPTGDISARYGDILSTSPSPIGPPLSLETFDLQPFRVPGGIQRAALISLRIGANIGLFEVRPTATGRSFTFLANGGTADEMIASECIGADGRLCAIRYNPGNTSAQIVTQPYLTFATGSLPSNNLPFPIGTIAPIPPGITNAPNGVLITAQDGTQAIFATISGGQNFVIQETFTPDPGNLLSGLMPVPGRGFVALQGAAGTRETSSWKAYQNSGSGWNNVANGSLSNWLPPQENFATLFWFNGIPMIDPTAEIIKLETQADWTRKTSAANIPAQVELSSLVSTTGGLQPTGLTPTNPPSGASYLMTSQPEENVSITALASDLALSTPAVKISPDSGVYSSPLTVTALFDEDANELFYREKGSTTGWLSFDTFTVGYPSTWLFSASNRSTGVRGPIVERSFSFPSIDLNALDTDGDSVPDYVERHFNLDAAGGADTDGDFQSDLEEILAISNLNAATPNPDPSNPNSNIPSTTTRTPPFIGEGFQLVAQAFNTTGQGASPANDFSATTTDDDFSGELIRSFSMTGNLLAEESVITSALAAASGAPISVGTPVPERSWITLASPTYFNVTDVLTPPRTGREIYRVMKRPVNQVASIAFVPSGTDLAADARGWAAAAQAAHSTHNPVTTVTELHPVDNAVAALAEQALFDLLQALPPSEKAPLALPAMVSNFTLFPYRNGESTLTPFSQEMYEALLRNGCDFDALIALLETAQSNMTIETAATTITNLHVADAGATAFMALPLDAFRSIIRIGSIADPGAGTGRLNPYATITSPTLTSIKTELDAILAQITTTKRPTATWSLRIELATTPLHLYDYRRQGNNMLAWLVDDFGERVQLEQGLGLSIGAIYNVLGYTDVPSPTGFNAMELIQINSAVPILPSDTDLNANLLDDDWENVFFAELGSVSPFDPHPTTGHTYLQYHLSGADPRDGSLTGPVLNMMPHNINYTWVPAASAYDLDFNFPQDFYERFDFTVVSSADISTFSGPSEDMPADEVVPGQYRFRLKMSESALNENFFRIGMSVKNP